MGKWKYGDRTPITKRIWKRVLLFFLTKSLRFHGCILVLVFLIEPFGSHQYSPIQREPCPQGFLENLCIFLGGFCWWKSLPMHQHFGISVSFFPLLCLWSILLHFLCMCRFPPPPVIIAETWVSLSPLNLSRRYSTTLSQRINSSTIKRSFPVGTICSNLFSRLRRANSIFNLRGVRSAMLSWFSDPSSVMLTPNRNRRARRRCGGEVANHLSDEVTNRRDFVGICTLVAISTICLAGWFDFFIVFTRRFMVFWRLMSSSIIPTFIFWISSCTSRRRLPWYHNEVVRIKLCWL